MQRVIFFFVFCSAVLAWAENNAKKTGSCILGKLGEQEAKKLSRSECIKYCVQAYADSKIEYVEDGTAKKTICEWNQKDLLVLGGFRDEGSPAPMKSERMPASTDTKFNSRSQFGQTHSMPSKTTVNEQETQNLPQGNTSQLKVPQFDFNKIKPPNDSQKK